ncbi:tetratricopeptide repeat protein [Kiloniella sp. EL199]|uniref:tetratricopeptide repeat protein n=1 Tax=Kiloniella sp. EL199 TaxID=2107581 RepID=UPI000EA20598|nr:SEL1-like repeat protein [Kiloniella sp. EL199]
MTDRTKRTVIPTTILLMLTAGIFYWLWQNHDWRTKNAPTDPIVNEYISQARGLQKQGKLNDAIVIFEKYALQGYPDAMFHVAKAYSRGWGVEPDLDTARHYYLLAVQYSFSYRAETAHELGRLFQRSKGPDCNTIAVEWFKKALKWKYNKAALQLAIHYEKGLGVDQDINKAIEYYEIAANSGIEQALLKYARLLAKGRYGITPDPDKALSLTEVAVISLEQKARSGSASAAKQLGRLYRDGELIKKNTTKAESWLLKAARLGSVGGMHDYAHLLLDKKPLSKNNSSSALDWLNKAADLGHGGAMTALGRFHIDKKYDLKPAGALEFFERGTKVGHGGAMEELARLYAKGYLVKEDRQKAIELATIGSNKGHLGCSRLLEKLTKKASADNQTSQTKS